MLQEVLLDGGHNGYQIIVHFMRNQWEISGYTSFQFSNTNTTMLPGILSAGLGKTSRESS